MKECVVAVRTTLARSQLSGRSRPLPHPPTAPHRPAGDPVAMKEFVVAVHARAAGGGGAALSTRARVLLELVVDVKNNRWAGCWSGGRGGGAGDECMWMRAAGSSWST